MGTAAVALFVSIHLRRFSRRSKPVITPTATFKKGVLTRQVANDQRD